MNERTPRRVQTGMTHASATVSCTDVDPVVLRRARRGDPEAFAELLRHHDRALRVIAHRLLGDRQRMDDVLQEAYVKAYRSLPGFRGDAAIGTWLFRVVTNACMDDLRRRRPESVPLEAVHRSLAAPDAQEALAERDRLSRALDGLSPEHRAAVLLVDLCGFDYAAAGEALGVPAGTIGSRLSHARAALRVALEGDGGCP